MRKFLLKTLILLLAAGGVFTWLRRDASVLAGASALGMDDSTDWLAANSQDPKPFDLLEAADTGMLRISLPWNEVSSASGIFTWAYQTNNGYKDFTQLFARLDRRGIQPVVVLSGGPIFLPNLYPQQPVGKEELLAAWENYVRAAVQQFGSQVDYWQIGADINDPAAWGKVLFPSEDLPVALPDPALYADMLRSAYAIIKSSRASDTVILGGLVLGGDCAFQPADFLQSINDLEAWYAFDMISVELMPIKGSPESAQVESCAQAPVQSVGIPLADSLLAVNNIINAAGKKPVWVHNLVFSSKELGASAGERATLPEIVESDYLARATAILLAYGGVERVFWRYAPLSAVPGAVALQTYANLSRTLGNAYLSSGKSIPGSDVASASFRGGGKRTVVTWRITGGEEALPVVLPGFEGYSLLAWSADVASMKSKTGVKLQVDSGGSTALLVSERPVLISAKPLGIKESITAIASDSAAQAGKGFKAKVASFVQAQKVTAAEKVGAWVDEQQLSLMQTLKNSFNHWLRKSLGLAKG